MQLSLRGWFVIGACAAVVVFLCLMVPLVKAADAPVPRSQLTDESLGNMLAAMGLQATRDERRFDFSFRALYQDEEWDLTMSAVLSQNDESVWVMAWLDELPRSAADVPRTALLRLLAQNDRLGKGTFFAYVAGNRRFVLQRVVPNRNLTTAEFRGLLQELGGAVAETYPYWAVANWASETTNAAQNAAPVNPASQSFPARPGSPTQSALRDSKFEPATRR